MSHTYAEPGRYYVTLRVTDVGGRTAQVRQEVVVYLQSGSEIFYENFSDGAAAPARWKLDPTWASEGEGTVVDLSGPHGFALRIDSGADRWHRRSASITIPPLRAGQKIVFSIRVMMARTKGEHTMTIFPLRKSLDSVEGSLPYYLFSNEGGGAMICEPVLHGSIIRRQIPFIPNVYRWHTYRFTYTLEGYEFHIDDTLYASGRISPPFVVEGEWSILLGEESHTEACNAYFDEIRVWIEE